MKLVDIDRLSVLNLHYNNYTLDYFLDCQQELGVKCVELLAAHQGLWLDDHGYQDPVPIKEKLDDHGLTCPVFTPENCSYGYQGTSWGQRSLKQTRAGATGMNRKRKDSSVQ